MEPAEKLTFRVKNVRTVRRWQIVAAIASALAVVMTALFIWQTLRYHQLMAAPAETTSSKPSPSGDSDSYGSPCPAVPMLLSLPKRLPDKLAQAFRRIDNHFKSFVDENASLPAISCNVFYKNATVWQGHYGSKRFKEQEKPDADTRYRIGSITKVFAVLLVFKLYEDGLISSLDDPLSKYAPDFHIDNPFTQQNITLRQIASQMAGLPREAPCVYHCNGSTRQNQLFQLRNRSLVLPPWTMPSYSNLGYALLGRLLTEDLLNRTFEEWTSKEILEPLGMNNTGFKITDQVRANMALPYETGGKLFPFMNIGWLAPAGQMYSTINDLTKLGMMFTQPEKQSLFKPGSLREMMLPVNVAPDGQTLWGSPWEMEFVEDFLVRGKGGSIDTYTAFFTIVPELELGMSVLISTYEYIRGGATAVSKISHDVYKIILPALNETLFDLQNRSKFPMDTSSYVGTYKINETNLETLKTTYRVVKITQFQNLLAARIHPTNKLDFSIRYIGSPLVFQAKEGRKMSCLMERLGIYEDLHFDPPGKNGHSPGFSIPGWKLTAVRVPPLSGVSHEEKQHTLVWKESQTFVRMKGLL